MKVVQILPALQGGGVERGTLEVGKFLAEKGHQSIVVSGGGRMVKQLEQEGSQHILMKVGDKKIKTLFLIAKLRQLLLEIKPDIVHLRSRLPAWLAYKACKKLPEVARPHLITTVHGAYSVGRYSRVMVCGERVIAVSEMIKRYIINNYPGVESDRIAVIHRGVDTDVFKYGYQPSREWLDAWNKEYPDIKDRYVVTLPGRLTRLKGHEEFFEVIRLLNDMGVDVHGLLVGEAHIKKRNYERFLMERVKEMGLTKRVSFVGHRNDLREIMAVSNVVLSLTKVPESFGRTTIESLSMGVPVLGYNHGGVAEQLAEIFPVGAVDVGDVKSAAEKLFEWHQQPPAVKKGHRFTLENMLESTLSVYKSVSS